MKTKKRTAETQVTLAWRRMPYQGFTICVTCRAPRYCCGKNPNSRVCLECFEFVHNMTAPSYRRKRKGVKQMADTKTEETAKTTNGNGTAAAATPQAEAPKKYGTFKDADVVRRYNKGAKTVVLTKDGAVFFQAKGGDKWEIVRESGAKGSHARTAAKKLGAYTPLVTRKTGEKAAA